MFRTCIEQKYPHEPVIFKPNRRLVVTKVYRPVWLLVYNLVH